MADRSDRTDVEKALARERDARQQLLRAQEVGKIGSWEVDLEANVLTWNDMVFRIFEIAREDFGGTEEAFFELVHPDDRPQFLKAREDWLNDGGSFFMEHRIVTPTGKVKWVVERAEVLTNEAGKPLFTTGTVQDITDLKQAVLSREDALQKLRQESTLVRIAGEIGQIGGWRYVQGSETVEWTDETARIHDEPPGTSPTTEDGMSYYAPEDRPRIQRLFARCLETGEGFDDVFRIVTAKGRVVWVRSIGEPEYGSDGRVTAVQGAFQDITKLVEAQNQAAQKNAELRVIMSTIEDGFLTLDGSSRIRFANEKAGQYLGRAPDELVGRSLWEAVPASQGTDLAEQYEAVRRSAEQTKMSGVIGFGGRSFETTVHATATGTAILFRDATEEHARRRRLDLLMAAIEHVQDMIVITSAESIDEPDGPKILYANRGFERATGYTRDEAIGRTPRFLQGPDTSRETRQEIRQALERQEPVQAELINYDKSGQSYWAELEISPVLSETGEVTHFVAAQRDITERKRSEERLRESEERFRLISRASSDVIWDWDIETGAFWLSENYEDVFGRDITQEPKTFDASIARIHPEDRERVRQSLYEAAEGTGDTWSAEYRVLNASGGYSIVEDRAFIIRDAEGRPRRMVAGMKDLTRLRNLDEQLRQSQKLEAVGQLTGGVAHDFNNILTIILGNIDMLEDEPFDAPVRTRLDAIAEAAERAADLIRSLLAFARRQPLAPTVTDVDDLLRGSKQLIRQGVAEDIDILYDLGSSPAKAMVDTSQLQSAILNLVFNAAHAITQSGRITIETQTTILDGKAANMPADVTPGAYVLIAVSDNGIGMTAEQVERAFEPFYTTRPSGSGLGLSSVYGFLKQSGGYARIYSELGMGTTVRLYLPVASGDEPSAVLPGAASGTPLGNGEHVLLVEDEASLRTSVGELVETLGYRVTVAADSAEAISVLSTDGTVDLLFTDVVLSGDMNGGELADAAHRIRADLKVLFTSGYTRDAIVHGGHLSPDVHLLAKPYRQEALAQALRDALDR